VINPQNGQILDDAKPRPDGLSNDSNLETEALAPASRMRNRVRARSRVSFINASPTAWGWQMRTDDSVQDCSQKAGFRCQALGRNLENGPSAFLRTDTCSTNVSNVDQLSGSAW